LISTMASGHIFFRARGQNPISWLHVCSM
jgi:hypothetical protein